MAKGGSFDLSRSGTGLLTESNKNLRRYSFVLEFESEREIRGKRTKEGVNFNFISSVKHSRVFFLVPTLPSRDVASHRSKLEISLDCGII